MLMFNTSIARVECETRYRISSESYAMSVCVNTVFRQGEGHVRMSSLGETGLSHYFKDSLQAQVYLVLDRREEVRQAP